MNDHRGGEADRGTIADSGIAAELGVALARVSAVNIDQAAVAPERRLSCHAIRNSRFETPSPSVQDPLAIICCSFFLGAKCR